MEQPFYQVITQKDFYAKEIIMQLLVAFNLYKNYEEGNTGLTKFLMNAKVVLPKTLFVEESASGGTSMARMAVEALATGDEPIMTLPSAEMEQYQAVSLANINIERHKTLKKELEKVEGSYKKSTRKTMTGHKLPIRMKSGQYLKSIKGQFRKPIRDGVV